MHFCQVARADSQRALQWTGLLSGSAGPAWHCGGAPPVYANEHARRCVRGPVLGRSERFRGQQRASGSRHEFRLKNKLLSPDATTISLCLTLFPGQFLPGKGRRQSARYWTMMTSSSTRSSG